MLRDVALKERKGNNHITERKERVPFANGLSTNFLKYTKKR